MERVGFLDGGAVWYAEQRGRGGKNEARNFVGQHRFQQRERVRSVVAEILLGEFHGFAGFDGRGQMHDAIDAVGGENAIEGLAIGGVSYDEFGPGRHCGFVAVAQIVEDDDLEAFLEEQRGDRASDISGASGD